MAFSSPRNSAAALTRDPPIGLLRALLMISKCHWTL
jgi:hypothetical protein